MIKITVIIPVYNVEAYLEQCLNSVVNQSLNDIEVIVVDDGSTDGSRQIIDRYVNRYNNIICLTQENKGVSVARNEALKVAKGQYIYYIDSDDYLEKDALNKLYSKCISNNLDIIIFSHNEIYTEYKNQIKSPIILSVSEDKIYSGKEVANMVLNLEFMGTPWNKMFKREKLINNDFSFEPGRYVQDWYPIFVQIYNSNRIGFIKEPLYNYRIRLGSTTLKRTKKNLEDYCHAAKQIAKYAKYKNIDSNIIDKFEINIYNYVIDRFYNLCSEDTKNIYNKFYESNFINKRIMNKDILKRSDISLRVKINIFCWNTRIYILLKNSENTIKRVYKKFRVDRR